MLHISHGHQLSPDQESVFLQKFGEDKSDQAIAQELSISEEAYRKRMGEIYRKFEIIGKGPGKHSRLLNLLNSQFQTFSLTEPQDQQVNLDALVNQARNQIAAGLQERCGTMRVLDMSQPVQLEEIYTNVDVLEKITSRRRLEIVDLMAGYRADAPEQFRLGGGNDVESRVSALEILKRYAKLIILGKPGAGKTTLLKYAALQCLQGKLWSDRLPIFITLRQFASDENQPRIQDYIIQDLATYGLTDSQAIQQILYYGKALILLDGLDEVREEDNHRVIEEIRSFSEHFYRNRFVISNRIASQQYVFEKFIEVEIADFEQPQILGFAAKWFVGNPLHADRMTRKLEEQQQIKELATNPLLLTLLCLVFEELGDFPANRSELYKEGLDILLKKWDAKRNIERHQIYKKLSVQRKENLLAQVAFTTFTKGDYFFKQEELEQYIINYICNLPNLKTDPESLQLDSEAILKSIEAQHGIFVERAKGIYSFSHLTFQEYLTARELIDSINHESLVELAEKITEKRWRDVLSLTVGMLRCADELLLMMKQHTDQLLAHDEHLQDFLQWVYHKACSVKFPCKPQSVRAFYLALARANAQALNIDLASTLSRTLVLDLDLERNLNPKLDLALDLVRTFDLELDHNLDLDIDLNLALEYAEESQAELLVADLKAVIQACPDDNDRDIIWQEWAEELRQVMIEHRNIGHNWKFSQEQKQLLRQYYDANRLLIDCLSNDCYVTQAVRQEIESTLLLAIAEISYHYPQPNHPLPFVLS